MPAKDAIEQPYAGELFRTLAEQGRLVLEPDVADEVIAGLEQTLEVITARLRVIEMWERLPGPVIDDLPPELAEAVTDAVFAEQLAPGHLQRAADELPKYVEAIRLARRKS